MRAVAAEHVQTALSVALACGPPSIQGTTAVKPAFAAAAADLLISGSKRGV